mmetsp:Transcript_25683/g.40256  ORF Transcript_25683/g.40256 Transcript_25683/m.40256 type:complete len:83 (-) Transcript_25683:96-344(-)|eukprot:CAMPEP_0184299834 /NCGR_PEP_ID=MMETSP1049-20130417/10373_1 /TAXON_ID=77928 /ORGANISM="Proteomonas sulcata, Strain CCMP704" /LENGTH=82 /DNA_ID=CAMNT_0026610391 /DNA_START=639 /DNA_END=887 /DNA_ORIENTATION=+
MFGVLRKFQALEQEGDLSSYDSSTFTGNVFADSQRANATEWPDFTGGFSTSYDPFGDGPDANAWATSFDTTSTNPIQAMNGF